MDSDIGNPDAAKYAAEFQNKEVVASHILALRQELKQTHALSQNPQEDNDKYAFSRSLQKLKELTDEERTQIGQDEEVQKIGQREILDAVRKTIQKGDYYHGLTWVKETAKLLHTSKDFSNAPEHRELLREFIMNAAKDRSAMEGLVNLATLLNIPEALVIQPEVQQALPKYLDLTFEHVVSKIGIEGLDKKVLYLDAYFPGENKASVLAQALKGFSSGYTGTYDDHLYEGQLSTKEKVAYVVEHVKDVPQDVITLAVRDGILQNIQKENYFHASSIIGLAETFHITEQVQNDDELKRAAQERAVTILKKYDYRTLSETRTLDTFFHFDEEFISSTEFQHAIRDTFRQYLLNHPERPDPERLEKVKEEWNIFFQRYHLSQDQVNEVVIDTMKGICEEEVNEDKNYRNEKRYGLVTLLKDNPFLQNKELLLNPDLQQGVQKMITEGTQPSGDKKGYARRQDEALTALVADFPLTDEVRTNPDVMQAAQEHFYSLGQDFNKNALESAKELAEKYNLDDAFVKDAILESLRESFDYQYKTLRKRQELFGLTDAECTEAVATGIRNVYTSEYYRDNNDRLVGYLTDILSAIPSDMLKKAATDAFITSFSSADSVVVANRFRKLTNKLGIEDEILTSEQAQEAYGKAVLGYLARKDLSNIDSLFSEYGGYPVDKSILPNEKIQEAAHSFIVDLVKEKKFREADKLADTLSLRPQTIEDQEAQGIIKEAIVKTFDQLNYTYSSPNFSELNKYLDKYPLPAEAYQDEAFLEKNKAAVVKIMGRLDFDFTTAVRLMERTHMSPEAAHEMVEKTIDTMFSGGGWASNTKEVLDKLAERVRHITQYYPDLKSKVDMYVISKAFSFQTLIPQRDELLAKFAISQDITDLAEGSPLVSSLTFNWQVKDLNDIRDFAYADPKLWKLISENPAEPLLLLPEEKALAEKLHLAFKEAEIVKRRGINFNELQAQIAEAETLAKTDRARSEEIRNDVYKSLFEGLKSADPDWHDYNNIVQPFERGAAVFGYEKMFAYLDKRYIDQETHESYIAVTRHDALHAFNQIVDLYDSASSEIPVNRFYGNILKQVRLDDRFYEDGTAIDHLNAIAKTLNTDYGSTLAALQKYRNIDQLQELATVFDSPKAIFASWNNLKRYSELTQLLKQSEIFDQLAELKSLGKEELYQYVSKLAFHPDSKVDMQAVMKFWRTPYEFLTADASHTPEEVHNRKKPSNYIEIPHLDLTAEELRDSLVEGDMDRIQAFSPMEATYDLVIMNGNVYGSELDLVKAALGSRRAGIAGMAKDSQKLFGEINKVLKAKNISMQEYLVGAIEADDDINRQLDSLVFNESFGIPKNIYEKQRYVAQIHKKSEPEGVLAGNDTACCMPFGDGKNTVYMFNPNTAQFTLQIQRNGGGMRTIAQSVLTKDKDIDASIPDVIGQMGQEGGHLYQIVPEQLLEASPSVLACDNVEVAANYQDGHYTQVMEMVYADFFKEYMSRFGEKQNFDPSKIVIGQGYGDALTNLPTIPNTFAPLAPVSYSDKTGEDVYIIDFAQTKKLDRKTVRVPEVHSPEEYSPKTRGVHALTFEDALSVAYLEGKAYSDNTSLIQYLHNMENGLIAKDINNIAKDRPNMSFKYVDDKGKMRGYILAYEGTRDNSESRDYEGEYYDEYEDSRGSKGESVLYISDLASDKESPTAGGRLILALTEAYKANYLDKDKLVPMYMEARETTSYAIVKKQLDKIGAELGLTFELEEFEPYEVYEKEKEEGDDDNEVGSEEDEKVIDVMHPILIRPMKKAA